MADARRRFLFIDTGAFLARHVARDQHHAAAAAAWNTLARGGTRLYTSNFPLDETITLLGRRAGHAFAAERAEILYASPALAILRPDAEDERQALVWFKKL